MNPLKAVIPGIWILCSGAVGLGAEASTLAHDTEVRGPNSAAADTTAPSPSDSTLVEAPLLVAGHWRAAETEDEEKQRLEAIEEATDDMGRFRRGRARSRLKERTSPPPSLMLEVHGSKVTIVSGDRRLELELGGSPIEVSGNEGAARLSATTENGRLIVVARSDEGERTTTYRAEGAGLSMEVTMTSGRLAGPLQYATTYARME
jgi:hypothetical protein